MFAGTAVRSPPHPDRAVTLISIVPCLPPPCCLTLKNLWVTSAIWSLILSSSPHLAVKIQLHPEPICRPWCLTEKRIGRPPNRQLSQLRTTYLLNLGNLPLLPQAEDVSVSGSFFVFSFNFYPVIAHGLYTVVRT